MSAKAKSTLKVLSTRVERMDLRELDLLELNARFMRHETYAQLVENIRRDGVLTSVPFAVRKPRSGRYEVLSGNHRVQAAIDAGVFEADVMLSDDKLSRQQRVAIQLSHNAIAGEDDPAILKQLYEQLEEVDWRQYAGLDDQVLGLIEQVQVGSLAEANLTWLSTVLVFLPEELAEAEEALRDALASVSGDKVWVGARPDYEPLLDALAEAGDAHDIHNQATALQIVLAVYRRHRTDLQAGYLDDDGNATRKGLAPISTVLGTDLVPIGTLTALQRAVERMVGAGEIPADQPWQALERLLAGDTK